MIRLIAVAAAILAGTAGPALAHTEAGAAAGLAVGFAHPLGGLDHILAMVAVGLLGTMLGGRAQWYVPAAFVTMMLVGAGIAVAQTTVPFVEQGILGSVLILGTVIAFGRRIVLPAAMTLVGGLAVFHGLAHGAEIPAGTGALAYGAGFAAATILLHALGLAIGLALQQTREAAVPLAVRASGGAIALAGTVMVLT